MGEAYRELEEEVDTLTEERNKLRNERDGLQLTVDQALKARDDARKELKAHRVGRDNATKERDEARKKRNDALAAFKETIEERDEARREREEYKKRWNDEEERRAAIAVERNRALSDLEKAHLEKARQEKPWGTEPWLKLDGATELKEHDPESLDLDELDPKPSPLHFPDLERLHTLTSRVIDAIERKTGCQGIDADHVHFAGCFREGDSWWSVEVMGWSATAPASLEQAFDNLIATILGSS